MNKAAGILHKYANSNLIDGERKAFQDALVEKHKAMTRLENGINPSTRTFESFREERLSKYMERTKKGSENNGK